MHLDYLFQQLDASAAPRACAHSFREFLERQARVKCGARYEAYHFAGREALGQIVERIDGILGADAQEAGGEVEAEGRQAAQRLGGGKPPHSGEVGKHVTASNASRAEGCRAVALQDASLAICGGAQFGKTVLMLNLLVYLVAVRFRNVGYYLPDDDLVQGIVDGKLRPDVLDQIPEVARLIQLGRTMNQSGRAVHRKGALLVTDGERTALAYLRGMGKVPTTFSMDVVIQDEKDDIAEYHAKFLSGRLTASDLRFSLSIGTQRYHGAGQNREFEEGTQHVGVLFPIADRQLPIEEAGELASGQSSKTENGSSQSIDNRQLEIGNALLCPEEHWPQVCRLSRSGVAAADDAQLTLEGDFADAAGRRFPVTAMDVPGARVYLADPVSGAELDRRSVQFVARRPEREAQRKWSYRVSQLIVDAIDLRQIVAAWAEAVRDPEKMTAFCTDRLALPRSFAQGLDPAVLRRARESRSYSIALTEPSRSESDAVRFAGLDMGDRCWFVVVEEGDYTPRPCGAPLLIEGTSAAVAQELRKPMTASNASRAGGCRAAALLWAEQISAERVRERVPELCAALGVRTLCVDAGPLRDLSRELCFRLAGREQRWDEAAQVWRYLRAAAVEFTVREGQGLRQKAGLTQDGAVYPLVACNREEAIGRVIGALRREPEPGLLLPERSAVSPAILTTFEQHLLAGSRQERGGDGKSLHYVDHCENHFLLATAYALVARQVGAAEAELAMPEFRRVMSPGGARKMEG